MYTTDKEYWDKFVKRMDKLGIKPADTDRGSKMGRENKYLAIQNNEQHCFEWQEIIDGLTNHVEKLLKQNKEQQETIDKLEEMRGWLASKELQQSMLARLEYLEGKVRRTKK